MQESLNSSLALIKSRYSKKNLIFGSNVAALIGISFLCPPLFLIPLSVTLVWLVHYNVSFFQRLRQRKLWLSAFAIAMAFGAAFPSILPAEAAFSFLFSNSETVLKNCVLADFTALATIAGVLFGGMRVAFMVGMGVGGYQLWRNRGQSQEFQEMMSILLLAIMIVVTLGFFEPYVVGTGAC